MPGINSLEVIRVNYEDNTSTVEKTFYSAEEYPDLAYVRYWLRTCVLPDLSEGYTFVKLLAYGSSVDCELMVRVAERLLDDTVPYMHIEFDERVDVNCFRIFEVEAPRYEGKLHNRRCTWILEVENDDCVLCGKRRASARLLQVDLSKLCRKSGPACEDCRKKFGL